MRRRQISNMHGGYRGSGVTINWNTTTPYIERQPEIIKPLPPSSLVDVKHHPHKHKKSHDTTVSVMSKHHPNIAGIVGITLGGVAALSSIGFVRDYLERNKNSGIVEEEKYNPVFAGIVDPRDNDIDYGALRDPSLDPENRLALGPEFAALTSYDDLSTLRRLRDENLDPVEFHYH